MNRLLLTVLTLILLSGISIGGYLYWTEQGLQTIKAEQAHENPYVALNLEAFDVIIENYWQEASEAELAELYQLSLAKASGDQSVTLATSTKSGVGDMLAAAFDVQPDDAARKALAVDTLTVVLYNLAPQGRSGLYTQKEETDLRNRVANINPEKNLYEDLGVSEGASTEEVTAAYEREQEILAASTSPEAAAKLEQVTYAHDVLSKDTTKQLYDEAKVEPTVSSAVYGEQTLYVNLKQIAPTTLKEFVDHVAAAVQGQTLTNLIVDLRGNVGGALDFAPYFLGIFIGPNQYAADLYHQGEREPMRTPEQIPRIGELEQFEEIAFLTDSASQSTAELSAAIFKRQNLATVVGVTTKGWGTVENTFPLETQLVPEESYVLFLVHSLTLRDDQQPIEGNGVEPDVAITDADWATELPEYFSSPEMRATLIELMEKV